jgi:hypothetical protein
VNAQSEGTCGSVLGTHFDREVAAIGLGGTQGEGRAALEIRKDLRVAWLA